MSKDIYIGHVVVGEMPLDSHAVSPAGNLAEMGIISALADAFGKVDSFIYTPGRLWPRGKLVQKKCRYYWFEGRRYFVAPYIALPILRGFFVSLFLLLYLIRNARKGDRVWMYNLDIPGPLPVLILSRIIGFKKFVFAFDIHVPGETVPRTVRWRLRFFKYRIFLGKFDGVVAITRAIVRDFGISRNSVVLHGGVQSEVIGVNLRENDAEGRVFLFAGRLDKDNSVEEIIRAFEGIHDPSIRLIIAGDGALQSLVLERASVDTRIEYLGKISHDRILELYRIAHAVLCIRKTESLKTPYLFPSKLIEAISSGALTICTRIDFVPTTLDEIAIVLAGDDVESIRDGIQRSLVLGERERALTREKAVEVARNHFVWVRHGEALRRLALDRR